MCINLTPLSQVFMTPLSSALTSETRSGFGPVCVHRNPKLSGASLFVARDWGKIPRFFTVFKVTVILYVVCYPGGLGEDNETGQTGFTSSFLNIRCHIYQTKQEGVVNHDTSILI